MAWIYVCALEHTQMNRCGSPTHGLPQRAHHMRTAAPASAGGGAARALRRVSGAGVRAAAHGLR